MLASYNLFLILDTLWKIGITFKALFPFLEVNNKVAEPQNFTS